MLTLSHERFNRPATYRHAGRFMAAILFTIATLAMASEPGDSPPDPQPPRTPKSEVHGVVATKAENRSTALAGVPVTLKCNCQPEQTRTTQSDNNGVFQFTELDPGNYLLEVSLEGFTPISRTVAVQPNNSRLENVQLEFAAVTSSVDVHAQVTGVAEQTVDAQQTLTDREITALPVPEPRIRDVLTLVPGVIRTQNGTLYIKGEAENQGMLLVDSAQMVDPVTGTFTVGVPASAVQTVNVYETPFNAQYGGFSGGLTTVETKAPPASWQFALMDPIPGMRGKNGHIVGISSETPRIYLGGPILKNRVNISESFDYIVRNRTVRGQPWPIDETKTRGFNSFTSIQAILSPRHLLTADVAAFSVRTEFADISALIPQSASSNSGFHGASLGFNDSYQFNGGTLMTIFRYTRFDSNAYPQGDNDMLITPEGWRGNFFNSRNRTGNQIEAMPTFQFSRKNWLGTHDLTIGASLVHRSYTGATQSHPTQVLREDGSLAETIEYRGRGVFDSAETEIAEFAQDHWIVNDRFSVDAGIRLSTQSNGRTAALAPRAATSYSLDRSHRTILRAGVGVFYDRVPLLAATYAGNPARVVSLYDQTGRLVGTPMVYQYVYVDQHGSVRTSGDPGTSPRNVTWNIGIDRELRRNLTARLNYLQSKTTDVYTIEPLTGVTGPLLGLEHTGNSRYREFQTSLNYRVGEGSQVSAAYIRSSTRGDLNTLASMFVPFAEPVIRPNANTWLASDVPNRLVGSGIVQLPWHLTVSPVIDVHTGLRYSYVDTVQDYVGTPNSHRFPTYFSVDVKLYREFKLPDISMMKNAKLRVGIYSLNLTNHQNARDVISSVESPYFGHFLGFQHRVTGFVLDYVR